MSEKDREELKAKATILENRSDELTQNITAFTAERDRLQVRVNNNSANAAHEIKVERLTKPKGFVKNAIAVIAGPPTTRMTIAERIAELNAQIEGATTEKDDITARLKEIGTMMEFYRKRDSGVFDTVNSQAPEHMVQQAGDVNYADMRDFDGILDEA